MKKASKEFKHFRKFLAFLGKRRVVGASFFLMGLLFAFLPSQDYYGQLVKSWQNPRVLASHFVIPPPLPIPKNQTGVLPPGLSAKAALVIDVPSWVVLFQKNETDRLLPASTTKIMTALVALSYYRLDEVIIVPQIFRDGQNIKLRENEKITFENLLYALLVASANDAAETLAANYPGGREGFITEMNRQAMIMKLKNTHFVNPTGIDEEGQYTSALDLAGLAKVAIQNPTFAKVVATSKIVIYSQDQTIAHEMSNINVLLNKLPGVKGIKTGWTINAGECLVIFDEQKGRQIITVILGSEDRFGETEKLLNWVFANFKWELPV